MSFPHIVKQRPVCVCCGEKCGRRHREWPINQPEASPWDGTSWYWQYNPFCTLRCALRFARAAHVKGMRRRTQ